MVAASTLLLLTACGTSSKSVPFEAPPLDPRDEKPCYDPGVGDEAISTLAETRVALADCTERHGNVVEQYNEVRENMGKSGPR